MPNLDGLEVYMIYLLFKKATKEIRTFEKS